jgi:Raf kinase inhibitor-like YbhB/YbcL family protein
VKLSSPAFRHGCDIPSLHTFDGADRSPPLTWHGVPREARSLVLIVDDHQHQGVTSETWGAQRVHWLLYDIPPTTTIILPGTVPRGARVGTNDWDQTRWNGPCPLAGRHRYLFTLYAIDVVLGKRGALTREELMDAIDGHVVGEAALDGRYERLEHDERARH